MILFRCDRCGRAFRVEDQYAGGSADCEQCGHHIRIPRESDPDVVLVFKAGESEEGTPLTRSQVAEAFERGLLRPTDLVYENGLWRPLAVELRNVDNAVIAGEAAKGGLELVLRSRDGSEVTLQELPPIPIAALKSGSAGESGRGADEEREKKGGFRLVRTVEEEEGEAAGAATPRHPGKGVLVRRRRLWKKWSLITVQVLAGLVACWYGYKLGLGPLISALRGKPTRVIVVNPGSRRATAVLGWRHLKREIPPDGIAVFSLYVGMGERQTLRMYPAGGGSVKFAVPLHPGASVIVNPGRRPLIVFDRGKIASLKLGSAVKRLADDLANNRPPLAADLILKETAARVAGAFGEVIRESLVNGSEYEIEGAPADKASPQTKRRPRKHLLLLGRRTVVSISVGSVEFSPLSPDSTQRIPFTVTVRLPGRQFKLHKKFAVRIPKNAECRLRREAKGDLIELELEKQAIDTRKGKLRGQWSYRAARPAEGETWDWLWRFQGEGRLNKKKISVVLTLFRDNPVPRLELR